MRAELLDRHPSIQRRHMDEPLAHVGQTFGTPLPRY